MKWRKVPLNSLVCIAAIKKTLHFNLLKQWNHDKASVFSSFFLWRSEGLKPPGELFNDCIFLCLSLAQIGPNSPLQRDNNSPKRDREADISNHASVITALPAQNIVSRALINPAGGRIQRVHQWRLYKSISPTCFTIRLCVLSVNKTSRRTGGSAFLMSFISVH